MLGCIQPMSSPMMKRMLGFCCCADAGMIAVDRVENETNSPSQIFLLAHISGSSQFAAYSGGGSVRPVATYTAKL
jgi:hypothetical protein